MRLYDPIGGEHMNVMKAGLANAHRIVAVSDGYAWECQTPEGGWGLDAVVRDNNWKLRGIVNGIDYMCARLGWGRLGYVVFAVCCVLCVAAC